MAYFHVLDYCDETKGNRKWKKIFDICFESVLNELHKEGNYEICLSLVSVDKIHKLNKEYRNMDRPTDVLTFAYREADFLPDEPIIDLGSIIISPEIAKKQANDFHHPMERELAFLFIHGLLHSFGYDHHDNDKQAEEMFALQNKILNELPYDFYTNINKAKKLVLLAQAQSYSPYSQFKVGAIVCTKDGKYHPGFNIENSAYGDCMCAERVALFSTYAKGYHKEDIASLTLITSSSDIGSPCGSCRQVMSELMELHCPVYIFNKDETKRLDTTVEQLLPYVFTPEVLKK